MKDQSGPAAANKAKRTGLPLSHRMASTEKRVVDQISHFVVTLKRITLLHALGAMGVLKARIARKGFPGPELSVILSVPEPARLSRVLYRTHIWKMFVVGAEILFDAICYASRDKTDRYAGRVVGTRGISNNSIVLITRSIEKVTVHKEQKLLIPVEAHSS